jgi:hypothetical protein
MNKIVKQDLEAEATSGLPVGYADGNQSLAVQMSMAEIDMQITTAHAYPRSITRAVKQITTLATLDDQSAAECIYALPRGGKPIKGPSIRLAEIIAGQWGNNRSGTRVVHVDRVEKYVEAEGVFHDLETNVASTARVRRRIVDSKGRLYNDDMIIVTGNAACAIAKRNAILAGVPKAVWRAAYNAVEGVIAGDVKTLAERRPVVLKAFAAFGVKPEQICAALEIGGIDDITIEHLVTLTGMHSSLKSGEETVESMFPKTGDASTATAARPQKSDFKKDAPAEKAEDKPAEKVDPETGEVTDENPLPEFGVPDALELGREHSRQNKPRRAPDELQGPMAEAWIAGWDEVDAEKSKVRK